MGTVYLIGAGPGDPGLLTRRGARLLRRADVVVHDALVDARVLDLAPAWAERVDVGKRAGRTCTPQAEIQRILIEAAHRAPVVVRLKGGDPFVFGRGAEEALALRDAGVRFRVVPGVTAAVGVAAYAGISLTHRDLASALTFVTGQEDPTRPDGRIDWEHLAHIHGTLVIYMGMRRLRDISATLIHAGRSPDTPAAVIEWGTLATQRLVTAPLREIADRTAAAGLGSPGLIIIGDVVGLREQLEWFAPRPARASGVPTPR